MSSAALLALLDASTADFCTVSLIKSALKAPAAAVEDYRFVQQLNVAALKDVMRALRDDGSQRRDCSSYGCKDELVQRVIAALYPQHASAIMADRALNTQAFDAAAAAFDADVAHQARHRPLPAVQRHAAAASAAPKSFVANTKASKPTALKPEVSATNLASAASSSAPIPKPQKPRAAADSDYKKRKKVHRPPISDATRQKLRAAAAQRSAHLAQMKSKYGVTKRRPMKKMMSPMNGRAYKEKQLAHKILVKSWF